MSKMSTTAEPPAVKQPRLISTNNNGHEAKGDGESMSYRSAASDAPLSSFVNPMLTDLYQVTMVYGYWKSGRQDAPAVFEAFFRKSPFKGEYTVFAGLSELIKFLNTFAFADSDIAYLRTVLSPDAPDDFFQYLRNMDCSQVTVYAIPEGTVVFGREPLVRVEGPLAVCQLLETTVLNLLNFPSLIATNAARMRNAIGEDKVLLEFGLRRAQGPDGGMTATRYSIVGGFDGTSNVLAGKLFGVEVRGTHAHAFVGAFDSPKQLATRALGSCLDFYSLVESKREKMRYKSTNTGELVAFVAYAIAFPTAFNALVDTYDTLASGVPNFLAVALALHELGYRAKGVRLDSGDLAVLSMETRSMFIQVGEDFGVDLSYLTIVASNDVNEEALLDLVERGHSVDSFGIGTNLVTCQAQPALGMVYKLMQLEGKPVMKLSNELVKVTIPGRKRLFRLMGHDGLALCDLMIDNGDEAPLPDEPVMCRHPYDEQKRLMVHPLRVVELLIPVFVGPERKSIPEKSVLELREIVREQLRTIPAKHRAPRKPVEYPVMISSDLYMKMHNLWLSTAQIPELR